MLKLHPSDQPSLGLSHSGRPHRPFHAICVPGDFKSVTPSCFILDVQQVVHTSESEPSPSQSRSGSLHPPFFISLEASSALQVSVVSVVVLLLFFHRNCFGMIASQPLPTLSHKCLPGHPGDAIPLITLKCPYSTLL